MHKLFYTAAIPLFVSSAMTSELVNSHHDIESSAYSPITTHTEEQNDQTDDDSQSGIFAPNSTAIGSPVTADNQVEDLRASTILSDFLIPNLATNLTEEETIHVAAMRVGSVSMIGSAGMTQPRSLIISEGGLQVPFQIAPDSHLVNSMLYPAKSYNEVSIADNASLAVDLILSAGDYEAGEYTYILANTHTVAHSIINADLDAFSVRTEQVTTEEGLVQLLLKLTVTEAFTVTETEEKEDSPPLRKAPSVYNDDESSEEDDHWGEFQESVAPAVM